ncbi:hypothetical protein AS850_14480 [Frondihabitans sp. 762G35]|nr:hypothetical protein AS850_14480 [Frondihabitans sp. 762G35]
MADTDSPSNSLLIVFRISGQGWFTADLRLHDLTASITASYLMDTLPALLAAVRSLLRGASSATAEWADEPGEFIWAFERQAEQVQMTLLHEKENGQEPDALLKVEVTLMEIVSSVTSACERLLRGLGEVQYFRQWGYRFPLGDLRDTQQVAGLPVLEQLPSDPETTPLDPLRALIAQHWQALLERTEPPEQVTAWVESQGRIAERGKSIQTGLGMLNDVSRTGLETAEAFYTAWQSFSTWAKYKALRHDDDPQLWGLFVDRMWLTWLTREVDEFTARRVIESRRPGLSKADLARILHDRSLPDYAFESREMKVLRPEVERRLLPNTPFPEAHDLGGPLFNFGSIRTERVGYRARTPTLSDQRPPPSSDQLHTGLSARPSGHGRNDRFGTAPDEVRAMTDR